MAMPSMSSMGIAMVVIGMGFSMIAVIITMVIAMVVIVIIGMGFSMIAMVIPMIVIVVIAMIFCMIAVIIPMVVIVIIAMIFRMITVTSLLNMHTTIKMLRLSPHQGGTNLSFNRETSLVG